MRKLLFILLNIVSIVVSAQDYYWYNGAKKYLSTGNKEYVIYKPHTAMEILDQENNTYSNNSTVETAIIAKGTSLDASKIVYRTTSYTSKNGALDIFVTDKFYVKLKSVDDVQMLQQMAGVYDVDILRNHTLKKWYILGCKAYSKYNALELANIFYESGLFEACEPEFIGANYKTCSNDSLFYAQWNLKNTGQYSSLCTGIDINYCNAQSITSGDEDVVIAVFDWGVDLEHPDLNIYHLSYDAQTVSSPSRIYHAHGTASAGIIGAIGNNNIGVAGIAPACPIMSISMSNFTPEENISNAFKFAADNGCSVISCSWNMGEESLIVNNGIKYALTNGRNGLGCVIVFSADNGDIDSISSPANSDEHIIVVGAISPCGKRIDKTFFDEDYFDKWGSQYGPKLDIMAPGISIPTTDWTGLPGFGPTNYNTTYEATSAACPHVAAVAGLVLSVNPNLTAKQVADIIETTAQRVGGYDYAPQEGRPNGKWHQEMGYGLVDAYAAVLAAQPKYIQNQVYQSGQEVYEYATEITAGYAVTDEKPYGDVVFEVGSDVTLRGMDRVVLKPGFHAKAGSKLHIKVDPPTTIQAASSPQQVAPRRSSAPTDDADSTNEEFSNNRLETVASNMIVSTSIYTISGQLIQTISGGLHNVTYLPNGMYILQHRMSDGSMRSEKIANNK